MTSCIEKTGDKVESGIATIFTSIGNYVGLKPRRTIAFAILLTVISGGGFMRWTTENRTEKLWVPQETIAEQETAMYEAYYQSLSRFNTMVVQSAEGEGTNVITKANLLTVMDMHDIIATKKATVTVDDKSTDYSFTDLCTPFGGACADSTADGFGEPICSCFVNSILRFWNYNKDNLEADDDVLATINANFDSKEALESAFGLPTFDSDTGALTSAEAFSVSYFVSDRSKEAGSDEEGTESDPINEGWELDVFLNTTQSVPDKFSSLKVDYLAGRSFPDEFGNAISGDLLLVQVSYVIVFLFLGATMGKFKPGTGSRWTMSLAALTLVGLSTAACFGLSSAMGLFYGPVHSLLPFILLGIGVDDAFVIVNAFNRERKVKRSSETNEDLAKRSGSALARAGASITVTSLTDLVAFGISASSSLPALASFCAYAAVGIVFLWIFAATFFTSALVLDERRQRDNRRECLCCVTRKNAIDEDDEDVGFQEDGVSKYFRNYHAPAILSKVGKFVILCLFATILGLGINGALQLSVENTDRSFIPAGSYLTDFINTSDRLYPSAGVDLFIVFEGSTDIYEKRSTLASLKDELTGKSEEAPYIAEPNDENYRNVMSGLNAFIAEGGAAEPTTEAEFLAAMKAFLQTEFGGMYAQDVIFADDGSGSINAIRIKAEFINLTKIKSGGKIIDDADKQIESMDATRAMVEEWGTTVPQNFPYSERFFAVEGFKIIRQELFQNVGLALLSVAVIVLITVASPVTALLITLNVAACIVEILGAMYYIGIAIDSVSVINIVLAVGLSIDYSAHVGHCFMTKGGMNKDRRVLESLADIGAAVLSGATTTFLAVVVLLFSTSYVFVILSQQFAITVALGLAHGLILLPVLLSLLGPKAFVSAEAPVGKSKVCKDDDEHVLKEDADAKEALEGEISA